MDKWTIQSKQKRHHNLSRRPDAANTRGELVVADKGYRGEPDTVSFPNHFDEPAVAELKRRICARQETFFSRMKNYKILHKKFRHKPVLTKHKAAFEAIAVIIQYGIENGSPLFAI